MSDLAKYIEKRKKRDNKFAVNFDEGYQDFKLRAILKTLREKAGLTQDELAKRMHTHKSAISRIENRSEDVRISTLIKFASVLGKHVYICIE